MANISSARIKWSLFIIVVVSPILALLALKIRRATLSAQNSVYTIPSALTELPDVHYVEEQGFFSWDYIVESTLSVSLHSSSMKFLVMVLTLVAILTYFVLESRSDRQTSRIDFLVVPIILTFGSVNTALYVRDLPDEAYVWGSKVENFLNSGRLGVELFDGTFAESTVGTLQFLIAAIIKGLFKLSTEQSLILPVMSSYLAIIGLSYNILRKNWPTALVPIVFSLALTLSTKFVLNVVNAFDNILAVLLLIFWISAELDQTPTKKRRRIRLLVAIIGPLIRIDLIILSLATLALSIVENFRHVDGKSRPVMFRAFLPEIASFASFMAVWTIYKIWAFGMIQPAMMLYKSPSLDLAYIWAGVKYSALSIGKLSVLLVLFFVAVSSKFLIQEIGKRRNLLFAVTFFLFSQMIASITSGGDYFGPYLARYVLPSIVISTLIVLVMVGERVKEKRIDRHVVMASALAVALTFSLVNDLPRTSPLLDRYPFQESPIGRVTCDNMAIHTLKSFLKSEGRMKLTIMTAEVNNAAFHMDARLVDTMGLVDARLFPRKPNPYSPGNTLRKYRIIPPNNVAAGADVMWLYGSATCQDFDPRGFMLMGEQQSVESKFLDLLNSHQSLYRYDLTKLFQLGYVPTHLQFKYRIPGNVNERQGEVFSLVRTRPSQ